MNNDEARQVFYEIFADIPREGPGDIDSTKRAFSILTELPAKPEILDIGCGSGTQTLELITLSRGHVTAIDVHQPFLDSLNQRARTAGVSELLTVRQSSMFELPFEPSDFDAIWSEGAIYIIGWEKGLRLWRSTLKERGYLVASHISWLTDKVPEEPKTFWEADYPEIATVARNLVVIERSGYDAIDHFVLPERGWWDGYYTPIERRLIDLRKKYLGSESALEIINGMQHEIDLYRRYSRHYGYVFYIARRKD